MGYTPSTTTTGAGTVQFDTVTSVAMFNIQKERIRAFIQSRPLFAWLYSKGQVMTAGGDKIKVDVEYGESDAIRSYVGSEKIPAAGAEFIVPSFWDWRNYVGSILLDDIKRTILQDQSLGPALNIMKAYAEYIQRGFNKKLNYLVWNSTGTGADANDIIGVPTFINATPTTGMFGGINRATASYWQNLVGGADSSHSYAAYGPGTAGDLFIRPYNLIKQDAAPDAIFSGLTLNERYEQSMLVGTGSASGPGYFRFTDKASADLGFPALTWKNIPWYTDVMAPPYWAWMLRSDTWKLYMEPTKSFSNTGWIDLKPTGRMAAAMYILLRCALVCSNPQFNALIGKYDS